MPLFSLTPTAILLAVLAGLSLIGGHSPAQAASAEEALALMRSPVAGDRTLNDMMGVWKGNGTLRQTPGAREEAVRCRLTNQWAASQTLMKMQLACIAVDYRFTATGHIGREGSAYRGAWTTSLGQRAVAAGRRSGGGLALSFTSRDSRTGQTVQSNMAIRLGGRSMTNTLTRTDPETGQRYTALTVSLQR